MPDPEADALYAALDAEVAAAGGMQAVLADPDLRRVFGRKLRRLPPLSAERVGEIMRGMRERLGVEIEVHHGV